MIVKAEAAILLAAIVWVWSLTITCYRHLDQVLTVAYSLSASYQVSIAFILNGPGTDR